MSDIDEFEKKAIELINTVFTEDSTIAEHQKEFIQTQSNRLRRMAGIVEDLDALNKELKELTELVEADPETYKDSNYVKEHVKRLGDTALLLITEYKTLRNS